jgi:hypothetical protein
MHNISWNILEYKKKEKNVDWYWAVIVISLSLAIIAFVIGDGLFSIFIILATLILLSFSNTEPRRFEVIVDKRGFKVGKDTYPFATLDEFWVDITEENSPKILLKSKKVFMPLIVIPLEDHHHLDIRDFLLQYLPEKEMHEPLSQKIMEKLGF